MSGRNRGGPSTFGNWAVVVYRSGFAVAEEGKLVVRVYARPTRAPLVRVWATRDGAKRWVERAERARVETAR